MKITYKGKKKSLGIIQSLVSIIENLNENKKWVFNGLTVELDVTVDYSNKNALIRWTDIDEGFNDKLIVNSLAEFELNFKLSNA